MRLHITVVTILLCSIAGAGRTASARSQANSTSTFVGTTAAPAQLLQFLGAPAGANAELIEWALSLTPPSQYSLHAAYGLTQPNFPGIQRDRHELDRQGTWTARKGTKWSPSEDVIDLGGLAFVRVGPSVLHVLSADGSLLACAGITNVSNAFAGVGNPLIVLFDWKTGQRKHLLKPKAAFQGTAWGVAFHKDGYILGFGGGNGGELWFWKPDSGENVFTLKLPNNARDLALHPDGRQLAIPFFDGSVRLYQM